MNNTKKDKKMTVYIIHHSHTDVGYTDTQEKMKAHHIAFIKEAVELAEKHDDFVWNCEGYWGVQQFFADGDKDYIDRFVKIVKDGRIGLSGSYLNLTELVSSRVLSETLNNMKTELGAYGLEAKSAMTADVNGYSWGFASALLDAGVTGLLSNIHTHHGYHPLFRKQNAFFWETPTPHKDKLLVWNGDHYLLGNELGISQALEFEYTIQDGLSRAGLKPFEKSEKRIFAYIDKLREDGYPYDFVTISVSGNMTDNSPPSLRIPEFIKKWNGLYGDKIELKMSTLDEFFAVLRKQKDIPTYKGDWTDWWADGVGSTSADVIQYRDASRKYNIARKLDKKGIVDAKVYNEALFNLMFYSEHTWGYSSSITEPCHPQVNNLDQWKRLFALKASEASVIAIEKIQRHYGETAVSLHKEISFRAVNPHNFAVKDMLVIDVEHFYGHENFVVVDKETKAEVPFFVSGYSRGPQMCIFLDMAANQTKTFLLKEVPKKIASPGMQAQVGIDGIGDLAYIIEKNADRATIDGIENKFFSIAFEQGVGVTGLYDKKNKRELINPVKEYPLFTPIYEVTPLAIGEDYLWVRRNMGRNRKAVRTERDAGKLKDIKVLEDGALYSRVELVYELAGCDEASVILTAHKHMPNITIDFRLHKKSERRPENLYLALPVWAGAEAEMYTDKAMAVFRPRIDQLPGTCIDFYSIQNGFAHIGDNKQAVAVCCKDAPLISMGTLKAHPIRLAGEKGVKNLDHTYSWIMNNLWETNFRAGLGGFYQFRYNLCLIDGTMPQEIFQKMEAVNEGVLSFYSFEKNK